MRSRKTPPVISFVLSLLLVGALGLGWELQINRLKATTDRFSSKYGFWEFGEFQD